MGRLSDCHCSYCSRQLNSTLKRPCEGASGQHNFIPSPPVDCSGLLYLQHILTIQSVLSEIWVGSPVVLHTVCLDTAIFHQYLTRHLCTRICKNGNLFVFYGLLRMQSALFSMKCLVFQENRFPCFPRQSISRQEDGKCRHRFHICSSNYVKFINTAILIKHRRLQPFQALQGSHADIMLYSSTRQQIHESSCVYIKESPAQRADLYINIWVQMGWSASQGPCQDFINKADTCELFILWATSMFSNLFQANWKSAAWDGTINWIHQITDIMTFPNSILI